MNPRSPAFWLGALAVAAVTACTNGGGLSNIGGGGGGTPSPLPSSSAIGLGIPTGKIGVENDPVWGTVSGYTQSKTTQVLAFAPGSQLTIVNLSKTSPHTLNVIATTNGPPPHWPASPSLSFYASGNGKLAPGYATGTINAGASVTVTLSKIGTYLIGCAYHYIELNMRDVIQVVAGATPGPTASPGPGGYARRRAATTTILHQPILVDQRGRSFTLASLQGRPLVITFISAHCTDACPLIDGQFADAALRIARSHLAARLLTITLDPEHDSPRTMRELASRFDPNPTYWLLASGSIHNVHEVMNEFGVLSVEGKRGYRDEHTTFVYVMNRKGQLTQTMLASSALSDDIVEAARDQRLAATR
ncbi:MAG TPA: SCO family protein [Candidatus Cybelea sp.]|jgi:protein SCO1/2|nr:SCO family protein [Candidatus Cybelea sp.]